MGYSRQYELVYKPDWSRWVERRYFTTLAEAQVERAKLALHGYETAINEFVNAYVGYRPAKGE